MARSRSKRTDSKNKALCIYGCQREVAIGEESEEEHERVHVSRHLLVIFHDVRLSIDDVRQQIGVLANRIDVLEKRGSQRTVCETVTYSKDSSSGTLAVTMVTVEFQTEVRKRVQIMMEKTKVTHNLFSVLFKEVQHAATRLVSLENSIVTVAKEREAQLQELKKVVSSSITSYNGVLLWRLEGVSQKVEEARSGNQVSILSSPFYTSRAGYKLCARIYLHGDGIGRGEYLSLFIVVMKGRYDAILRWPFNQVVTMTLLDQSGRGQHVHDSFRADPTSTSFRRPRNEMNIASGCPRFMSLSDLRTGWQNYVVDDQMLLEIKVDTAGLDNFGGH